MSDYRPLDVIRLCWGLIGLVRPARASRLYGADPEDKVAVRTARVLGARDVAQATVLPLRAGRAAAPIGATVDVLHALSMVVLARVRPAWRRPALTSAAVSSAFALAGVVRHRPRRSPPAPPPATDGSAEPRAAVFTVTASTDEGGRTSLADAEDVERDRDELLQRLRDARDADDDAAGTEAAHEYAARVGARTRRILARRAAESPRSDAAWLGGVVTVLAGIWLIVGQWALNYPFDVTGQDTALRDTGLAVVVTLAGLRLCWLARERDRRRGGAELAQVLVTPDPSVRAGAPSEHSGPGGTIATALAVVAGVVLVAAGSLLPHAQPVDAWNEVVTGLVVLLAVASAWRGRRVHPGPTARSTPSPSRA